MNILFRRNDGCILARGLLCASIGASCISLQAVAQTAVGTAASNAGTTQALDEIIVTAERRTTDIQKTASSVSVRSGDDLQAEGKYSLGSILEDVPGLVGGAAAAPLGVVASGTDTTAAGLTIRGIPSNSGVGGSTTSVPSSAAIYVDGVYEGAGGGYDIDRVEVLRGPQGTLYGRSATSGVVAIHTRNPILDKLGGKVSVELGNYELRHYSGAVNIPLGDKAALRLTGNRYTRDGFDHAKDSNYSNSKDFRAKLFFQPTDDLSVLLGAAGQDNITSANGVNVYLAKPDNQFRFEYTVAGQPVPTSPGRNNTRQYWAEINWDLGFANLTYLPAFRSWETDSLTQIRATVASFDQTIVTPKDHFVTHELRMASRPGSKLAWQVGTLLYDNTLRNINTQSNFPAGSLRSKVDTERDTKAWGTFAEATYPITDSLRVTGGLRYDQTKVSVTQTLTVNATTTNATNFNQPSGGFPEILTSKALSGPAGERTFTNTTYKARIEYDLAPQNMIYAMMSSAVSPGDVSLAADPNNQPVVRELKSKVIKAYEIGSKNRFFNNTLQVNGSVFYNDYEGYQAVNINVNPVPPPAGQTIYDVLVAPVKAVGAEFEIQYKLIADGVFGLNLGYTHSYFSDRTIATGYGTTFGTYFGQSNVPRVVPFTAQLSYDHTFRPFEGGKLTFGGDVRYLSAHNLDRILESQMANPTLREALLPYLRADSEVIVDLNSTLSFADGKYSITGWVRNVGDNRYKLRAGIQNVTAGNLNNPGAGLAAIRTDISPPRTWGVSVSAKF